MKTSKLFLSTGHNPTRPGTQHTHNDGTTLIEHYTAAIIVSYLYQFLVQQDIKPILVPTGTLASKAKFINSLSSPDDILIEIHLNSFDTKVQGSECLSGPATAILANDISSRIASLLNIKNRGLKPLQHASGKPLYLTKHCKAQTIIIEPFFLDREGAQFFDLQAIARVIAEAIIDHYAS